jgi:hypothetical protein
MCKQDVDTFVADVFWLIIGLEFSNNRKFLLMSSVDDLFNINSLSIRLSSADKAMIDVRIRKVPKWCRA